MSSVPPPPPLVPLTAPLSYGVLTDDEKRRRKRTTIAWASIAAVLFIGLVVWAGHFLLHVSADAAALTFQLHQRMQMRDWDGIYQDSSSEWREAMSVEKSRALFSGIDRKLGQPVSWTQAGFRGDTNGAGRFMEATVQTKFSAEASGEESICWRYSNGKFRLLAYNVSSPELLSR